MHQAAASRPPPSPARRLWPFLWRAVRLRCPECGVSPLYRPARRVRRLDDWLNPLPGCDRCQYAYEREPGYFLPATWIVQFFGVFGLGTAWAFFAQWCWNPPMPALLVLACGPTLVLALLFVRHSKALWLAVEHAVDPVVK